MRPSAPASLGMVPSQLGVGVAEAGANSGFDLAQALFSANKWIGLQEQGPRRPAKDRRAATGHRAVRGYGVQATQYPEQQAEAALANQNAVIANRDSAAIGGVTDTTSTKRTASTQAQQYGWQQADIYRAQQLAALGANSPSRSATRASRSSSGTRLQQLELAAKRCGDLR